MMKSILVRSLLLLCISTNCFARQQNPPAIIQPRQIALKNISQKVKPTRLKITPFIAPAVLMGYGFVSVYNHGTLKKLDHNIKAKLRKAHPLFTTRVDDYIQFAPVLAVYGLNLAGVKGQHNLLDASTLYVASATIMGLSTYLVKNGVRRRRPNNVGFNSFPSGHTASAFAAAEFLHQEYKRVSPWYGYAGYFVAMTTGVLRMYNNKHWFSDVVAGAGFGIASTKIAFLVYPYIRRLFTGKLAQNLTVMPYNLDNAKGLVAVCYF